MADVRQTRSEVPVPPSAARVAAAAFWFLVWVGCWGVIACAVFLTVTRAFDVTRSIRVLIAHGVTPYLYFAVWPVAALAAWRRRWILTGASLALVAVHIAVTLPAVWPHATPSWAAGAPHLRVLVANVKEDNPVQDDAIRTILSHDVDALVLVEMTDGWRRRLVAAGVDTTFPHQLLKVDLGGGRGAAIYSKVPIATGPAIDLDRGRILPSAVFSLPGAPPLTVFAVHLVSPKSRDREERWIDNIDRLAAAIPTITTPFVYAGDFNSTRWHPHFGRLLGNGLTDAHEWHGRGLSRSWPNDHRRIPPVMRLDHALLSRGVSSTSIRDLDIPGSDHRGFVVELAVKPTAG